MSNLSEYLLEAQDDLIFRTGKPFGTTAVGETLPMPPQPTLAGALRSAFAELAGLDYRCDDDRQTLLNIECKGPLLSRFDENENNLEVLFPTPTDALYLASKSDADNIGLHRLQPSAPDAGCYTDLNDSLLPVAAPYGLKGKPVAIHEYWTQKVINEWLENGEINGADSVSKLAGLRRVPTQTRTHNSISAQTGTTEEGVLFQNCGLDFSGVELQDTNSKSLYLELEPQNRLVMLVKVSATALAHLRTLGADGRLVRVSPSVDNWPAIPHSLKTAFQRDDAKNNLRIRLILATPAVFANGYLPGWLTEAGGELEGYPPGFESRLKLRLKAVANNRWQAVSGWDIRNRAPKPISRVVPAGAVYWFEVLIGSADDVADLWLQSISDTLEDRRDGCGLALVGRWL